MKWISVKDSLPEVDKVVMVYTDQNDWGIHWMKIKKYDKWEIARRELNVSEGIEWYLGCCCGQTYGSVTHWMPLPDKPEQTS